MNQEMSPVNRVERNGSERAQVASVCYEEAARERLAPGGETPQGVGPARDLHYETQRQVSTDW